MARTFRLRVSTEARKLLRIVAPRPARWLWMVSLFFGLGCMMPVSASAQLDAILRNLLQNAVPPAQPTAPGYRPGYPPSPYPAYTPQRVPPPSTGYPAYSSPPPASHPPSVAAPIAPPAAVNPDSVADLQRMLNELGYDAGPPDGTLGSRTVQAVRGFQRDHGQPPSGDVTPGTLSAVRSVWYERHRTGSHAPAAISQTVPSQAAVQPSFDCARAANPTEHQICANPQLAGLDTAISQAFATARANEPAADHARLMAEQQHWLQQRDGCGADSSCIERSMTERLTQLRSPPPAGRDKPVAATVAAEEKAGSPLPSSTAGAAAVGIDVGALLHPPGGLRPLRLRIWDGMPLLRHPESSDTEAFLDLMTLGVRPNLLDRADPVFDQAADYARTFLAPKDPLNSQNWSRGNEFDKQDARNAFLRQYAEPLRLLAPRAPYRFAYATAVSLGRYDDKRHGFDLPGIGSYGLQRIDPLQPQGIQLVHRRMALNLRYDFDKPTAFWPIAEGDARAMVERLSGTNDRGERGVEVITVFEATDAEPQTVTLGLQIERLEVWDKSLTTRLYSFDVAPLKHQQVSSANPLARLLHPLAGLRAWPLSSVDGRPAIGAYDVWRTGLQTSVLAQDLFRLVAAGSIPGYLDDSGNLRQLQHFFSDQVIREVFLAGASVYNPNGWAGSDEFARERTRQTFYSHYAPALRELAPRLPFDLVYVKDATLGLYAAEGHAFPVKQENDSGDFLQRVRDSGLIPTPTFPPPELSWRLDPGRAEAMVRTLSNRKVKTAATYEIAPLDPTTKRLVIRLKAMSLYAPDLKAKLYDFPIQHDLAPYLTAGTPARLHVAEPAVLDDIILCLKFIEAGGERLSPKIAGACWDRVAKRDEAFHAASAAPADLAPDDARRPFFPRGGADRTPAAMAKFVEWAKIYAASLPATVVTRTSSAMSGEQADHSRLVLLLGGENPSAGANHFANFIKENTLQPDQLVTIGSPSLYGDGDNVAVLFVMPNRWSLYQLTIPKESFDRHPGTGAQSVSTIRLGAARLIRGDLGQNALAIDLTPVSLRGFIGDDTLANRTFDDIPALNGATFTSSAPPPTTQPPGSGPAPLDAAMVDLLAAKAVGDKLSQEALSYLVTRRWLYENGKGAIPGVRFFALGKRQPTLEEATSLGPSFVEWSRRHGPDLQARVTIAAKVDVGNDQTTAPWSTIRCLGKDLPGVTSSDRVRDWARTEIGSPGRTEEQKAALETLRSAGEAFYVGGLSHPCGVASPSISFRDPASFAIRIPHALPVPKITALGGRRQLDLTATLSVNSIALSQHPPAVADMLPATLAAMVPRFPGAKPAGEFITFDTSFIEARWSDASGKDVARLGADQGESLDILVKAFEQKRAKRLAAEATAEGPYGPDLVGVQLGMSFEDAERAIRKHMKVGRVLEGRRAFDEAEKSGLIKPMDSGKLFISEGEDELIAIVDEPPAAQGRVLAAWRRVSIPAGSIDPTEIFAGIEKKYGKPGGNQNLRAGIIVSWYPPTGRACSQLYAYGHADQIKDTWYEGGWPLAQAPASVVQSKAPPLPEPLFDPLGERSQPWSHCGPFIAVQLLTASMLGKSRDELDMTLTDIGPYLKAYAESRRKLREVANMAASSPAVPVYAGPYGPDMVGVKLGMTFEEAEHVVREHMQVGRLLQAGTSGPEKSASHASSGRLFISEDQSELIAIIDEPHGAEDTVVAAWRQLYEPQSATLEFVTGRLKNKYGQPVFGSGNGDMLFWGKAADSKRCAASYMDFLHSRSPISAQWMENGAPTSWRPKNGDTDPSAPVVTGQVSSADQGGAVEDCGPWLTMQFLPAQGYPPMNVIETTLTDRARYEKARRAGLRAQSPVGTGSIKF